MKLASKRIGIFVLLSLLLCNALLMTGCEKRTKLEGDRIAEIGQDATVLIKTVDKDGYTGSGSGFFIDGKGTLITAYHVIDGAKSISIVLNNNVTVNLEEVVAFNPNYDIAILKANYLSKKYLKIAEEQPKVGEKAYIIGSPLGLEGASFVSGDIAYAERIVGKMKCLQVHAIAASGNSGGPVLNAYGEVIGVHSMHYEAAENIKLAVDIRELSNIGEDRNYTIEEYSMWYDNEVRRSYNPVTHLTGYSTGLNSLVNRYDVVTGVDCNQSYDRDNVIYKGYNANMLWYKYKFTEKAYDKYREYLVSIGFTYDETVDTNGYMKVTFEDSFNGYVMQMNIDESTKTLLLTFSIKVSGS